MKKWQLLLIKWIALPILRKGHKTLLGKTKTTAESKAMKAMKDCDTTIKNM
jgi:hypothetical protein